VNAALIHIVKVVIYIFKLQKGPKKHKKYMLLCIH